MCAGSSCTGTFGTDHTTYCAWCLTSIRCLSRYRQHDRELHGLENMSKLHQYMPGKVAGLSRCSRSAVAVVQSSPDRGTVQMYVGSQHEHHRRCKTSYSGLVYPHLRASAAASMLIAGLGRAQGAAVVALRTEARNLLTLQLPLSLALQPAVPSFASLTLATMVRACLTCNRCTCWARRRWGWAISHGVEGVPVCAIDQRCMTIVICNLWHSIYLIDNQVEGGTDMYESLMLKLSVSVLIMSISFVGYNLMAQK